MNQGLVPQGQKEIKAKIDTGLAASKRADVKEIAKAEEDKENQHVNRQVLKVLGEPEILKLEAN